MATSLIPNRFSRTPFRRFLIWLLEREDIRVSTVHIEYFKEGGEKDPIVLKFGHGSRLGGNNADKIN